MVALSRICTCRSQRESDDYPCRINTSVKMMNNLISQETRTEDASAEAIHETGMPSVLFEDLPLDVLYTIVSKLPPKEFARTSVLSSTWRCMRSLCPRLTFDGVAVCKCIRADLHQHTGTFIHEVNQVLQKHHGKVVETLEFRMDLVDSLLVHHLNNWVAFAVSSRTKNLTLDLKPKHFWNYEDRYVFPFELLDTGSISRLQNMQLSFVSLKPPSKFRGFPNLRKLHIQVVHASRKDLEHLLSRCCNLEWLHIDRCHLNDELIVHGPLSRLLYLHVEFCSLTKIKFHAVNLATFKYEGDFIPIDLSYSSKLQNAYVLLRNAVFWHALISLNGLPYVQNLTLRNRISPQDLEKQWLWDNPLKFSCLRHLQLFMVIYSEHVDRILHLVWFLRATPFIENLEVHFTSSRLWLADVGPRRQDFGQCKYSYLKNMWITGFKAVRGQVEFLLHVVENAPALDNITVDTNDWASKDIWPGDEPPHFEEAKRIAVTSLSTTLPQNARFCVI